MEETSTSGNHQSYNNSGSSIITNIAHDYLLTIILLLPIDAILSLSMTCKRFKAITSSDTLWKSLCKRDLSCTCVDSLLNSCSNQNHQFQWMKLYKQVSLMDSVCCHKLSYSSVGDLDSDLPKTRASHSLNFVSDSLVLFGGGSNGG